MPNLSAEPLNILLVEDDPSDVLLTKKALAQAGIAESLNVARDGVEALEFLRREGQDSAAKRPDLILLDLNMPRMDGREFLQVVKADKNTKRIPVVVLTTSDSQVDVEQSYDLHANCFITKPVNYDQFNSMMQKLADFWQSVVKFPIK